MAAWFPNMSIRGTHIVLKIDRVKREKPITYPKTTNARRSIDHCLLELCYDYFACIRATDISLLDRVPHTTMKRTVTPQQQDTHSSENTGYMTIYSYSGSQRQQGIQSKQDKVPWLTGRYSSYCRMTFDVQEVET